MLPVIDKKKTGVKLRRLMDKQGLSVKDVQAYLKLGSVQSIYHWLNGISLPTVDNLYAISQYLGVSMDSLFVNPDKKEELCLLSQNSLSVQGNRTLLYWTHLQKKK